MAFKITDPTGFVDSGGRIALPAVSSVAESGAALGSFARPTSVLWRRNNAFSTADLEVIDARIIDSNRLGSGIDVGEPVKVKASGDYIFAGYVMKQSMSASGGVDASKNEKVTLQCIDYKYDLFREVIIGQIGVQANGTTGEEATEGGPYGGGVAWFSGLRCVFNDRTFAKNLETVEDKEVLGASKLGNGRSVPSGAFSDLGGGKPLKIFDGNHHVINKEGGSPVDIVGGGRINAWSAWDMLTYILAYCYAPPFSKADIFDPVMPVFVSKTRVILSESKNGLDEIYPVNVDVQGLTGSDAITKVCAAAGYSWWLEPDKAGGASKIVVWRTGSPGNPSKSFYMGSGGSGMPRGLYRNLTAPLDYPLVTTKWNVDDISIDIDYIGVVGTVIGTTQNIRVQNVFFLVKGWANSVFFKFVSSVAIEASKALPGSASKEARTFTFKSGKDTAGKTIRYFVHKLGSNVTISLDRDGASDDTFFDGDSISSVFRRWITDDTGIVKGPDDSDRAPYKFHVAGLTETNGGLYMVKPRPFLSALLSTPLSGDRRPPKIGFPKFDAEQSDVILVDTSDDPGFIKNKRSEIARDRAKLDAAGKKFYPFGSKKGQIRILRDTSGCFIEGGFLDLQNITIDPKTNKITMFNPAALAAIEHDQAVVTVSSFTTSIGDIMPSRRWIDGRKFVVDKIYATQLNDTPSPDRVDAGDTARDASDGTDPFRGVDESAKLKAEIDSASSYYRSPKASMRVKIPTITTAYKLGDKIISVEGAGGAIRLSLEGTSNTVVGVQFNLLQMDTTVSVENERLNQRGLKVLVDGDN